MKQNNMNMKKQKCENLVQAREQIDGIDQALIELIALRQFYVDQASRFKHSVQDVQSPELVEQVIAKVRAHAEAFGADPAVVEKLYREMIAQFIQRELKEIRP